MMTEDTKKSMPASASNDHFDQMTLLITEIRKINKNIETISQTLNTIEHMNAAHQERQIRHQPVLHRLENLLRNKIPNHFKRTTKNITQRFSKANNDVGFKNIEKITPIKHINKPDISIITWDCAHNAAGPAYWLADALREKYKCEIIGGIHKRFGTKIWYPVSEIPVITRYKEINDNDWEKAKLNYLSLGKTIESDTIVCCKYRPGSIYILQGALSIKPRKVIFFIDDHEQAFSKENAEFLNDSIEVMDECRSFLNTLEEAYITAPNTELLTEFNSKRKSVLGHIRPDYITQLNSTETNKFVNVGFFGTVRQHKGLAQILTMLSENSRIKFTIGGDIDDESSKILNKNFEKNRVTILPKMRYSELVKHLKNMDFTLYANDIQSKVSAQTTAKISDALGVGVTPIITRTSGNKHFIETGVALDFDLINIPELSTKDGLNPNSLKNYFKTHLSYESGAEKIYTILSEIPFSKIKHTQKDVNQHDDGTDKYTGIKVVDNRHYYVHLWKQYDSGIWGRRVDCMASTQFESNSVKGVLVINKPVTLSQLREKFAGNIFKEKINQTRCASLHFQKIIERTDKRQNDTIDSILDAIEREYTNVRYILYPFLDYIDINSTRFQRHNTIIDIVDNQKLFHQRKSHSKKIAQQYAFMANQFTLINNRSSEILSDMGINIKHIVPNSGSVVDFKQTPSRIYSPQIWYPGTLDESRLDLELIDKIHNKLPEIRLNFIGSEGAKNLQKSNFKNIQFHKPVMFRELIKLISERDIIIIPHAHNALVNSMDPLKLYLGALNGLRVISTVGVDLKQKYNTHMGVNHDTFLKLLREFTTDESFINERSQIHPNDTWENRTSRIDTIFNLYEVKHDHL